MKCREDGCPRSAHARGFCATHYSTHRRAGTLQRFEGKNSTAIVPLTPEVLTPQRTQRAGREALLSDMEDGELEYLEAMATIQGVSPQSLLADVLRKHLHDHSHRYRLMMPPRDKGPSRVRLLSAHGSAPHGALT